MTAPRFLIDENLSPRLVTPAHQRGYLAMHVNQLGLRTEKDWDILKIIENDDWVLVTNNAIEFRGRYRRIEIHPGIVFLVPSVRGLDQIRLFEAALDHVPLMENLVNRAIDVAFDRTGKITVTAYDLL